MRIKRFARIGLRALGIGVSALALVTGLTLLILRTTWGGERLRRQLVSRVNKKIQGHLDIERLRFGGDRVTLWGVSLLDPDGRAVAGVARAEVAVSVRRLLFKQIRVSVVAIERPRLTLVADARGTNLARATAPRKKPPPRAPEPPKARTDKDGWVVDVDRFELEDGDITFAIAAEDGAVAETRAHVTALHSAITARYAMGNGSLDTILRLDGESLAQPIGPIHLSADAHVRADIYRGHLDGVLLGGTIKAHANIDRAHPDNADAVVLVAIPAFGLAGSTWGPLHVDGDAKPGLVPTLDLSLAIPGVTLSGKGGGGDGFTFDGRLALSDLAVTGKALRALNGGSLSPLAGRGRVDFWFGGPMAGIPSAWAGRASARIEHAAVGENVIDDLKLEARTNHLSSTPEHAALDVDVATIRAGATELRGVSLKTVIREQAIAAELAIASPQPIGLKLNGNLDNARQSLGLEHFLLSFPGGQWATEGIARINFGGERLSLNDLRLVSQEQTIAVDVSKTADDIGAHVAVRDLRLDRLPSFLVDPKLELGGLLDADVEAYGTMANPHVVARINLQGGRARGLSRIDGKVQATLADRRIDGTIAVDAPFAALDAGFKLPVDIAAPGAPIDVRLDVQRLALGPVMQAAALAAKVDGRVSLRLQVSGSADNPKVNLTADGKDLKVGRATIAAIKKAGAATTAENSASEPADIGRGGVHVTYAERKAQADITFESAHGGRLRVDVDANVDLSYPRIARQRLVLEKLPVNGKVVARSFNVAWLAQFNPRIETLGGRVSADARLAGTLSNPQFIGDVRWKDGGVVARVSAANLP